MKIDEIEEEVLRLEPSARARLAHRLLVSLDSLTEEENERLWVEEAVRRNEEIDAGQASVKSADEVLRDARARLA